MSATQRSSRPVLIWLIIGCLMIATMVAIGGITRLTDSGLSMVEWELFMGAIPPLNEQEWQETFEQYQAYPEYKLLRPDMQLSEFKSIFFWEFLHRQWGRLMGLVFISPFLLFLKQGRIKGVLIKRCISILLGGAAVGGLGWFMVVSGLNDRPDVSHYRLAIHLVAAFTLFGLVLWTALDVYRGTLKERGDRSWRKLLLLCIGAIYFQIIYGAFVAGLDAGGIYNTWPLMNGSFVPENAFALSPFWKNIFEHRDGVQFIHRNFAYVVVGLLLWVGLRIRKALAHDNAVQRSTRWLFGLVVLQFALGVLTLLLQVPVWAGVMHQMGALFLLAAAFVWAHSVRHATPISI